MTEQLLKATKRLLTAVRGLGQTGYDEALKRNVTLFELSPTKYQESYDAWVELNNAGSEAQTAVDAAESAR